MNSFDLHMHSCYSLDGQFTPEELVEIADKKGLKVIALSDHDCVNGVPEMISFGQKKGIQVIPAIECSTIFHGYDVHLLGYGLDIHNPYFTSLQDCLKELNKDVFHIRIQKMIEKYGVEIDEEQVLRDSHGENPWFLMCTQLFTDPRYQEIEDFKDYIPGGKRSDPAPVNFFWDKCTMGNDLFVPVNNPDFIESIDLIHKAGGLAVIAHPFRTFYKQEDFLQEAIDGGIDGIEAYSNYHTPEQCLYYEEYAKAHNLLITCGSDFHGEKKPSIQMGEYGLEKDGSLFLNEFLEKLDFHKK